MYKPTKLAIALALMVGSIQSYSQEQQDNEETKTDTVVVSATRTLKELQDVSISVGVVDQNQIKHKAANTIGELIEDIPGIELSNDATPGLVRVGIRGENAFRTLVLVDGQKVSEHSSMSGTPLFVSPSMVERIEVIKGPSSVLYGADALGGVINIITKKQTKKAFGADVSVGYNSKSQGLFTESMSLYGHNNGFTFRVSGDHSDAGDLKTPDGYVDNTNSRSKSGSVYLAYDFSDKFTAGIDASAYEGAFHTGSEDLSDYSEFSVDVPMWDRKKVNIFAKALDLTEELVALNFNVYYQISHKKMENVVGVDVKPMPTASVSTRVNNKANNHLESLGFETQSEWQLGSNNYLIAGLSALFDNIRSTKITDTKVNTVMPGNTKYQKLSEKTTDYNGYQNTYSAFLLNETTLPLSLTANYGARFTYVESALQNHLVTSSESKVGTTFGRPVNTSSINQTYGKYESTHDSKSVFNFGLVWKGIEDLALRANWSQGFRSPILQEKYLDTSMGSTGVTQANPNLEAETSDNFEIGARYINQGFSFDGAIFCNFIDNYITTQTITDGIARYMNVAKAKTFGAEVSTSYEFENGIKPYLSFNFMRRKYDTPEYETYYTNLPTFTFRSGVYYQKDFGAWTLSSDFYARGANQRKRELEDRTCKTAHGYTTANMQVVALFGANREYSVAFEANNIFDKKYYVSDSLAEAGRHFSIVANASF